MIINKFLTLIVFIFFSAIFSFAIWNDLSSISHKIDGIKSVDVRFHKILLLKQVISELQKERGLSNIYISNKDFKVLELLRQQKERTQQSIKKAHFTEHSLVQNLEDIYKIVDSGSIKDDVVFQKYTSLIISMILETKKLMFDTTNDIIKNNLIIYSNANFIQEYLGELRAKLGALLAKNEMSLKEYDSIVELKTLMQTNIIKTQESIKFVGAKIELPIEQKCFKRVDSILSKFQKDELTGLNIAPLEWFKISSCAIDAVSKTMNIHLQNIEHEIKKIGGAKQQELKYHFIFWALTIVISIILTIILYLTNKKMHSEQKILEDYKKAIDMSTIVSKTDKRGIITYVNEAFCNISGYSKAELVGKPHNIVRHPDVPKEVFAEVWHDLKEGKVWQGQIINLRKDRTPYWVYATISPIYDDNHHLIEYIAIRHDITEIIELSKEIKNTQYELIYRMGESVESRSKESGHHIQRVAHYSKLLAQYAGLGSQEAETIFIASTMHDMGKIAIPDSILLKRDKLDREEWEIMKTHAAIGHNILEGSKLPILKMAADIAYEHHEHYNGNGYPRGIKGEEISIYARIVAIADVFDALISERVYKKAWPLEKVLKLFREESGKQFDAELTQYLLNNIEAFMEIKEQFED